MSLAALVAALLVCVTPRAHATVRFQAPVLSQLGHGVPLNDPYNTQRLHPAYGDLDGDGRLDVVAPLFDSLAIYFGHGDGTFDVPLRVAIPTRTTRVALADFDDDGALDIAFGGLTSAQHHNPVMIYFGDGTGRAWTPMTLTTADDYSTALAGDFDGDGRADLVTLSWDASNTTWIRTYLSRPGRTFERRSTAEPNVNPTTFPFRPCDVNEDGRTDFVAVANNFVRVWVSRGDGTFQQTAALSMGPRDVGVGDIDGDHHADLVGFDNGSSVSTALGHGDGTFGAVNWKFGDIGPAGGLGDLDGDGILDLAFTAGASIGTRVGTGAATFAAVRSNETGTEWNPLDLVDVDGDERLDFVGLTGDELVVALGDGTGGLRHTATTVPIGGVTTFATADFDGDGVADVVGVDTAAPARLRVALGRPQRGFALPVPTVLANLGNGVTTGDFDGDGVTDVIAALTTGQAVFCRGRGDGGLDSAGVFAAAGLYSAVARDVTGDGLLDLTYVTSAALRVLPGNGAGGFGPAIDSPLPSSSYPMPPAFVGDVNGDGRADAIVTTYRIDPAYILLLCLGDGTGHFTWSSITSSYNLLSGIVADVDGDGRDDVVGAFACASCNWTGSVRVWRQQPGGTLAPAVASFGTGSSFVRTADVDGDGHVDLMMKGTSGPMIQFGDGTGVFGRTEGYGGPGGEPLAFADFDGDGHADLLTVQGANYGGLYYPIVEYARESTPPTVTLLEPSAGATYGPGAHALVAWDATDDVAMGTVDVFVSRHGRAGPFTRIAAAQPATGTVTWPVSGGPTDSLAFKLVARDAADNVAWVVGDSLSRISNVTAVEAPAAPQHLELRALRPNPARDRVHLDFALPAASDVTVSMHDVTGRRIAVLASGRRAAGPAAIDLALPVAALHPGVFFMRVSAGGETVVRRIAIVR